MSWEESRKGRLGLVSWPAEVVGSLDAGYYEVTRGSKALQGELSLPVDVILQNSCPGVKSAETGVFSNRSYNRSVT